MSYKTISYSILFSILFSAFNLFASNNLKISNIGTEKVHISYENKFGETVGDWIEPNNTKIMDLGNDNTMKIIFEINSVLFPVVGKTQETIDVKRIGNSYVFKKNLDRHSVYKNLADSYKIIMSPFFEINYTAKTDYNIIKQEILDLKRKREKFLLDSQLKADEKLLFSEIIKYRFIDELMAPLYKNKFRINTIPISYQLFIQKEIDLLKKAGSKNQSMELTRQYQWAIIQFIFLTNIEDYKTIQEQFDYINNNYINENLKNYLLYRLYQREYLNLESRKLIERYFLEICKDSDYKDKIKLKFSLH